MRMRFVLIFFWLCLAGLSCGFARDAYVSVSTGQTGHGFLRQRRDNCYVVLPKHVVQPAGEILVTVPGGDTSAAHVLKVDPSADLAILIVASKGLCTGLERSVTKSSIDTALSDSSTGVLHSITRDGSSIRKQITIDEVTDQTVTFEVNGTSSLQQGDSGSVLSIGNVPVGMLISVPDPSGRKGNAFKQTVIEDFWKRVIPPGIDCSGGCSFVASQANLVKMFSPKSADENPIITTTTTHYDFVYSVPEGIPLPAYFHVWRDKLESSSGLGGTVSTISTTNFTFSRELLDRDADINIMAFGFDTTGNMPSSIVFNGHVWSINITREGELEFLITLKP